MPTKPISGRLFEITPITMLREAVRQVPALRYAIGVGGIAAVVAIVLTAWKLEPQTAILGGLTVLVAMVILVVFAALSKTGPRVLRPLALSLAWAFLVLTVAVAMLFVSCAFFDQPKKLQCLWVEDGDCGKSPRQLVNRADAVLSQLYAGQFDKVYDSFAETVRISIPFANYRAMIAKMMAQPRGGPLRHKLKTAKEQAGYYYVLFEAEFDEMSTWYEGITFVRTPKGWELFAISIQPSSWSTAAGNARVLPDADPNQLLSRAASASAGAEGFAGHWIPPSGWRAHFSSVLVRKGQRTCDIRLSSGPAVLIGRDVLGGCNLQAGAELDIVGKVTSVDPAKIEIEQVRFQPT
jgi:hypothetical protein